MLVDLYKVLSTFPKYHESSKVFLTGRKTLKITSDKFNEEYSALSGISFAEKVFSIAGDVPLYQNDIVSTRSTGYEKLFDRVVILLLEEMY